MARHEERIRVCRTIGIIEVTEEETSLPGWYWFYARISSSDTTSYCHGPYPTREKCIDGARGL